MSTHPEPKRHRESASGQSERTEAVRKLHRDPAADPDGRDEHPHKDQPGRPGKAQGREPSSRKGEDVG